jgi:basic membrane protein A
MRIRLLLLTLFSVVLASLPAPAVEIQPKVAIAYDIGFLGDHSFNDAVHKALKLAEKKYRLVEPFVREVPTNGTAVDRLTRLRFLAKNGYTLIIAVGSGYRETVRRVSMEYPETQFALINDATLGQLNISNIYFREDQGAYLAGVAASYLSKRKVIAFVGSESELFESFSTGARINFPKIVVKNIAYPDDIDQVKVLLKGVDVLYSTWDGDASILTLNANAFDGKIKIIAESPDQFFALIPQSKPMVSATVDKRMRGPILELVSAALQSRALIDILDEEKGIYGREYNVSNGGIGITFYQRNSRDLQSAITRAELALQRAQGPNSLRS